MSSTEPDFDVLLWRWTVLFAIVRRSAWTASDIIDYGSKCTSSYGVRIKGLNMDTVLVIAFSFKDANR